MRQLKITQNITTREEPSLEKYFQEITKVSMLTAEEEVQLSILIKQGDKQALDRLTKANLRFVVSVAKQYRGQGLSLSDLINEGNIGLIKACQRFDETRGFKFISFAVWWIRQSILYALANNSRMVRLPLNKVMLTTRALQAQALLEQQLQRRPSIQELSEHMEMDVSELEESFGNYDRHVSLDSPKGDEDDVTLIDTMEDKDTDKTDNKLMHTQSLHTEITRSLQVLDSRQRQTICYFFGIGIDNSLSLEDIARKFDLTTERVRQIKEKALTRLRAKGSLDLLRSFLNN